MNEWKDKKTEKNMRQKSKCGKEQKEEMWKRKEGFVKEKIFRPKSFRIFKSSEHIHSLYKFKVKPLERKLLLYLQTNVIIYKKKYLSE